MNLSLKIQKLSKCIETRIVVQTTNKAKIHSNTTRLLLHHIGIITSISCPIIDSLPVELITQALRLKKNNSLQQATSGSNSELTADNLNLLDNNNNPELKLSIYMSKSKTELWNLLKIKTITRTLTLLYTVSGLF